MTESLATQAPGAPGIAPTWSSSAKEIVGCALGPSRVWFTIGCGIVNEVYHPRVDIPQIRDLGFIVADGKGFWVEVKRLNRHTLEPAAPGVPAVRIVHRHERFELALRITPSVERDVLLVEVTLAGDADLRPYALLAPHLGGTGYDNLAEIGAYRGRRMLWAEQGPFGLALAAVDLHQRDAWQRASAGYVGTSDGWQDFDRHGAMTWEYTVAGPGNVALLGELSRQTVLALGFGSSRESAATLAVSALIEPFDAPWSSQLADWQQWHAGCRARAAPHADLPAAVRDQFHNSAMVLRAHQDKTFPGTLVASLSVPWGNTRDERGGYHLVWPRDLVECAGALLAIGAEDEARDTLQYLIATQHADGHWHQNQWLGGKAYWSGIQLDEAAFPVVLAATLDRRGALGGIEIGEMIRRSLAFIARTGPASDQDRWEEDAGLNAFTLAVCIAALVSGAPYLAPPGRELALSVADTWNARLEEWTTAVNTDLARRFGVPGYYVRVAPAQAVQGREAFERAVPIKNRSDDPGLAAAEQVGGDFLQLVRFGIRRADDPLIVASITLLDELLKAETPAGPSWYRYTGDGYGEHDDGSAYDGTGRGRPWPLLTGERGHYELARGVDPLPYLSAMTAMASAGGMLPEQVWDAAPIPERGLAPGRPTGSAMPLAWAHAEFIKLVVSRALGRPFDRPDAVWERYQGHPPLLTHELWLEQAPIDELACGMRLRLGLHSAGVFRWSLDGWRTVQELETSDSGLGLHVAEIDTSALVAGQGLEFTFRRASGEWAGRNFRIVAIGDMGNRTSVTKIPLKPNKAPQTRWSQGLPTILTMTSQTAKRGRNRPKKGRKP